jgi:ATP-dependent helicase/nuclease subunit B
VRATILIGPAGSGKTFRCLAEVRAELKRGAEGLPLFFLAPKQATFQIERELLNDREIHGYTRLQVVSFERLARFALDEFALRPPRLLTEEGRVMVLRALLGEHKSHLSVFHGSARLPGFAHQLSSVLAELQRHHVSSEQLLQTAAELADRPQLAAKLRDLALMLRAYLAWLHANQLHDANLLFDMATDAVASAVRNGAFACEAVWLDGFAELSSQELALLLAVLRASRKSTLAFCTDTIAAQNEDWLSPWVVAAQTASRCCEAVRGLPGAHVFVEHMERAPASGRFAGSPALAHLERHWAQPVAFAGEAHTALALKHCRTPEAEAIAAAHEALEYVRRGGRFRNVGVLVRNLSGYQDAIRRAFTRYEIPFFIDRRESVAHHPLPELTRNALRLAAYGWQADDWFGVLKSGLVPATDAEIDSLENEALERGWSGSAWRTPLSGPGLESFETTRSKLVPPFERFVAAISPHPLVSGRDIARAIEALWEELRIAQILKDWGEEADDAGKWKAVHSTLWEQMHDWLHDLALAFGEHPMSLHEWVGVIDSGLSNLSVGVVPPALDQVMVGAVDRSRNPNLELAIVLGLNEGVFPAPAPLPLLLTEAERDALETADVALGANSRCLLGQERYFGYIACTRARQRLVLTWSEVDWMDTKQNPSCFVDHVRRMFPRVEVMDWQPPTTWTDAQHISDLGRALITANGDNAISSPAIEALRERIRGFPTILSNDCLSRRVAQRLYGPHLRTSVTSIERFAECPFKFFVHSGLRAQERKLFQVDRRKTGDFQHQVLKTFHDELAAEGKRWRDITPAEARRRIEQVARRRGEDFEYGLFRSSARDRFVLRQLTSSLQDLVEVLVGWMSQYQFDPHFFELRFGEGGSIPAWRIPLSGDRSLLLTGSIDRVDFLKQANGNAFCVVFDFKTTAKKIEELLLHNGIQIQLPAYLSVLRHVADAQAQVGVTRLIPAGMFYVPLRGRYEGAAHRGEVLDDRGAARRTAYQHCGRFDSTLLPYFDSQQATGSGPFSGEQFNYSITSSGELNGRCKDPVQSRELIVLLDAVDSHLRDFGQRILDGETNVSPFRKGDDKPCNRCDYQTICRIDPWTHDYRSLQPLPTT